MDGPLDRSSSPTDPLAPQAPQKPQNQATQQIAGANLPEPLPSSRATTTTSDGALIADLPRTTGLAANATDYAPLLNSERLSELAATLQKIQPTRMQRVKAVIAFLGTVVGGTVGGFFAVPGVGALIGLGVSLIPALGALKRILSTEAEEERAISVYIKSQPECSGINFPDQEAFFKNYRPIVKAALLEQRALEDVKKLVGELTEEVKTLKEKEGTLTVEEQRAYDNFINELNNKYTDIKAKIKANPGDYHARREALQTYINDADKLKVGIVPGKSRLAYFGVHTGAIAEYTASYCPPARIEKRALADVKKSIEKFKKKAGSLTPAQQREYTRLATTYANLKAMIRANPSDYHTRKEALQAYIDDAKKLESGTVSDKESHASLRMHTEAMAEYLTLIRNIK